jgi:ABC-2 type transport system ATP-binding protein
MRKALIAAGVVVATALCAPTIAQARDAYVTSFDGTQIWTHFYPAKGLAPGQRAPTVLEGPGWSSGGQTSNSGGDVQAPFGIINIDTLIDHGYNVLTWDPRGFGQSGGTVEVDDPSFEGRDVQALIDYVAQQPEAQLDTHCKVKRRHGHRRRRCKVAPNDPRVGMAGGSYGGGIQLVSAAIDPRIDAIVPAISWHSLLPSLFPAGDVKLGWGSILVGIGVEGATLPGGVQNPSAAPGRQDPHFYDTLVNGLAGTTSQDDFDWYAQKGPGALVKNIRAPTLLLQGTVDTLFPLDQAVANFTQLRANRVKVSSRARHHGRRRPRTRPLPVKMIWFCGGHGACFTGNPSGYLDQRTLAWFDRYLRGDKKVDTGPLFAWVADDGLLRNSEGFPLKDAGKLSASGSGPLAITPGQGSGGLIFASAAANAFNLDIPGPAQAANVVGAPHIDLTYSGSAAPQKTWVFAQFVNPRNGEVLGNIATPIPVLLDGQSHTISLDLDMVSGRAPAGGGYTLQLTPSSSLYDIQRSTGEVDFSSVKVTMPLGDPVPAPAKKRRHRHKHHHH